MSTHRSESQIFLDSASEALGVENSPKAVEIELIRRFPEIQSGLKNAADLIGEIILGESELDVIDDLLYRVVKVASVQIPCPLNDGRWLWEVGQIYNSEIIKRNIQGVSEKIQGGESGMVAAIRGVKEELGLDIDSDQMNAEGYKLVDNPYSAYKGIPTKTALWSFSCYLPEAQFAEEYREVGEKKTTIFGWR